MVKKQIQRIDRRRLLQAFGVSGLTGLAGCTQASSMMNIHDQNPGNKTQKEDHEEMLKRIPVIDIPVINGYYEGDEVWFIHTDTSEEMMAEMMTEMINYPTYHTPQLAEAVDTDEAAPLYVFTNGIDHSDEEPWGGGPFNYQIDVLDSVPGDDGYTALRNPHRVTWAEDASPEVLQSESEVLDAEEAGEVTIEQTDVVVTAPVVSWPGSPEDVHMGRGPADMDMSSQCPMHGENDSEMENHSRMNGSEMRDENDSS